ncbi:glutathione S-transferase [Albimonas donghaensis]|uniref:Glutathione S-transferase n=1 Tax=Albimonas donghaensis TaxID=356660 RepID=A0A1H3E3M0_9RHOB|nr:glutathione S-transferase family protein [Albimonas donghaensis]MBR26108.1 glutathione S-transferase family protein [Paracoccaceae bacterium]SDX73332.1 glutathione S-transferase [Albimonas donghaensis]
MRRLHHIVLSPYARKVRLALAEKRVEVELIEETPWTRELPFLRLNPAATVPVFVDDPGHGGAVVADSAAICEYLEETRPEPPLLAGDARQRAEIRRLVAWFDDKMMREVTANLVEERVMKKVRGGGHPDSGRIRAGSRNLVTHLEYIGWLADQRRWLAGDAISLADFAAAAHLSCLDYIDYVRWEAAPAAAKDWYQRIKSRPAFRTLLADHLPGFPPPEHYADLDF